ncbi:MAG: hypothetical protein U0V70_11335 [Terriglobia bacterium]
MIEAEITRIIEQELQSSVSRSVLRHPQIRSGLVSPQRTSYLVDLDWNRTLDFWLVYEDPDDPAGYTVAFDDSTQKFGLAITLGGFNRRLILGFYPSFQETLSEMYPHLLDHE